MRDNLSLVTRYGNEPQGHFSMGFIPLFHYESYLTTKKRMHKRLARRSNRKVHHWSKTGTEMLIGPTCLLDAMAQLCRCKASNDELVIGFEEAAKGCRNSRCRLFEALAYERFAKILYKDDPSQAERCNIYHQQAVAIYREWGAIAKAEHLDQKFQNAKSR
jgi:hypothetical protein